jgi:hypothetical protein
MPIFFDLAWEEAIKSGVTSSANMAIEDQSAALTGYVAPDVLSNIDAISEILGGCVADEGGGLDRSLPLAHPEYPSLFASSVTIKGVAFDEKVESDAASLEAPGIENYSFYRTYEYQINFKPRPYILMSNESVTWIDLLEWYDDDGVLQQTIDVPEEYYRFTDYEENPSAEYLSAQVGQFTFERADGLAPNGNTVPGQVKILENTSLVKFRWFQVPYSFIESYNSYIKAGQGKINQLDWYGWNAGTLLFLSFSYKRYTPPNPGEFVWAPGIISNEKLVDIEFLFKFFEPTTLQGGVLPAAPANPNHITAGHNLVPWLGGVNKGYYYAHGDANVGFAPKYKSYPFQLMFMDPDV